MKKGLVTLSMRLFLLTTISMLFLGCHALDHAKASRELRSGMDAYKSGKAQEAVSILLNASELDPDYAEPPYYIAQIYHQSLKDPGKAVQYYRMANEREPNNPQILYALGSALGEAGQYQEAIAALKESVTHKPDFARAWFRLGNAYEHVKDYPSAVEAYMSSIQAEPQMLMSREDPGGVAYHSLASLYQEFDINDKALAVYEDGLRTNPESVNLMIGLGVAALNQQLFDKAEIAFASALEKEPNNNFALFNRGVALMKLGRRDAAFRSFESFVENGTGSAEQLSAATAFMRALAAESAK